MPVSASPSTPFATHQGSCHCGRVRFEVDAPRELQVLDCNCSICRMSGFLHLIVPAARFPRSHPDGIDVNARCLDPDGIDSMAIEPFDDNDREAATAAIAHLSQ